MHQQDGSCMRKPHDADLQEIQELARSSMDVNSGTNGARGKGTRRSAKVAPTSSFPPI